MQVTLPMGSRPGGHEGGLGPRTLWLCLRGELRADLQDPQCPGLSHGPRGVRSEL